MSNQDLQLRPGAPRTDTRPSTTAPRRIRLRNPFARGPEHRRPERQPRPIPEGLLRDATYRRDGIYRRALALADIFSAAIAVLIGVPMLGEDALNPLALLALPLVLVVGKLTGLYDRDEHVLHKTTLDEVPTLFWVATLYALLIWLCGDLIVDGHFGRDQAVGVWGLLLLSMIATRAARPPDREVEIAGGALPGPGRRRDDRVDQAPLRPGAGPEGARGRELAAAAGPPLRPLERERVQRRRPTATARRSNRWSAPSGSSARSSPRAASSPTSCSRRPGS